MPKYFSDKLLKHKYLHVSSLATYLTSLAICSHTCTSKKGNKPFKNIETESRHKVVTRIFYFFTILTKSQNYNFKQKYDDLYSSWVRTMVTVY